MKKLLASLLIVCTLICAMTVCASADDVTIKFRPGSDAESDYIIENNAHRNDTQYFTDAGTYLTMKFEADFNGAEVVEFQFGSWGRLLLSVSTDNETFTDVIDSNAEITDSATTKINLAGKFDQAKGVLYIRVAHGGYEYTRSGNSYTTEFMGEGDGGCGGSLLFREDAILTVKAKETPKEPKVVRFFEFEGDALLDGTELNTELTKDGAGCASHTYGEGEGVVAMGKAFDPVDLTGCDYVEFWFYISDTSKLGGFQNGQIEICSGGTCDAEETSFDINAGGITRLIVGEPVNGWNLIRLPAVGGGCDWSRVNYIRFYSLAANENGMAGTTIAFDMMYGCTEGDAPAPSLAPVDPGDPTDPVDPNPGTFDAASSVAVFAVAALGIALVASKKRH